MSQEDSSTSSIQSFPDEEKEQFEKQKQAGINPWESIQSKVIFLISVFNFGLTCYFVGSDSRCWVLPYYYCIKFPILMIARYLVYSKLKFQWFLIEFCYFANVLLYLFLWLFPDNIKLFITVFVIANGPLLNSVAVLGNALVFHSLDKWTSIHIHIAPALITYVIRWKINNPDSLINKTNLFDDYKDTWKFDNFGVEANNIWSNSDDFWTYFIIFPFIFVVFHQLVYYIVTCHLCYDTFDKDPHMMTSFRHMFNRPGKPKNGIGHKIIGCLGDSMQIYVFGILLIFSATLAFGPTYLMWQSERFHLGYLIFMGSIGGYNGASYYAYAYQGKPKSLKKKSN